MNPAPSISVACRVLLLTSLALAACRLGAPRPELVVPSAPAGAAADTLHGQVVADPYRALEELDAPATRAWIAAESALTRAQLDRDPVFEPFRSRLLDRTRFDTIGVPVEGGGRLFFLRTPAGESLASLWVLDRADARPRLLVPASRFGEREALSGIWPSFDGRRLVLGVAPVGSPWYSLHLLEVDSARWLDGTIEGLRGTTGAPTWRPDGSAFFYARHERASEDATAPLTPQRLLEHRWGTDPARDRLLLTHADHPEWAIVPTVSRDGRYLIATTAFGSSPGSRVEALDLSRQDLRWSPMLDDELEPSSVLDADGETLVLQTTHGAPRGRIVAMNVAGSEPAELRTLVPESEATLYFANAVADRLVTVCLEDARHVVRIFGRDGAFERTLELPTIGTSFSGFIGRADARHAYFSFNSLVHPGGATVFRLDPRTGEMLPFERPALGYDPDDFVTRQVFYRSKDGTRVPLFLAHRRDLELDRPHPVLLYGYGAFGWAALPWYQPQVLAWMEAGGVYALAAIRGGGEYGLEWHRAGVGTQRRNAIADYLAAADWLLAQGVTRSDLLTANGGSLSGALPAQAAFERPGLFAGALIDIPVLDLVRYERFTGGSRWVSELGSVENPEAFRLLFELSPYHRAGDGPCPPPTLVTAGESDQTAVPSHAYKYIAALQARPRCTSPALLQVVEKGGHGFGLSPEQRAAAWARQLTFLHRILPAGSLSPPLAN